MIFFFQSYYLGLGVKKSIFFRINDVESPEKYIHDNEFVKKKLNWGLFWLICPEKSHFEDPIDL